MTTTAETTDTGTEDAAVTVTAARVYSLFLALAGGDPDLADQLMQTHAEANGDASVEDMVNRLVGRDQDDIVDSLLAAYPDQAEVFVETLFTNRGLEVDVPIDQVVQMIVSGDVGFTQVQQTLDQSGGLGSLSTETDTSAEQIPESGGIGVGELKIRSGATWYRIEGPSGTDAEAQWVAVYQIPGTDYLISFEASAAQMDAIYGPGQRPAFYTAIDQESFDALGTVYSGNIAEMEGPESFASAYERSVAAGLGLDRVPESLRGNAEIQGIIFLAESNSWSDERLYDELAKTEAFAIRFPEIEQFRKLGMSVSESVEAYLQFEFSVNQLTLQSEGRLATDAEINGLIAAGHSIDAVTESFQIFQRMEDNADALTAFNEILVAQGYNNGNPLTADDMFDFLKGTAPAELYDVYESAAIREAASGTGLGDLISAADAEELARLTVGRTGIGAAYEGLVQAAQHILRLRTELNLGQFDLDEQDLIDISLGISPRSGKSQVEVGENIARAIRQAQGTLERRARPYFGFTPEGTPQAASLANLRPLSA